MSITIRGISETMSFLDVEIAKSKRTKLLAVANELVGRLEEATPKDTGEASRAWKVEVTAHGLVISNSKDYIEELNAGSSKQAPGFFVEKVLLENPHVIPNGTIVEYR
jgi:hypothetical protein